MKFKQQKLTKDIGSLNGKVLIFGGVYSNWQALAKMQNIAQNLNIPTENIICTGDVVGYCAQPEEVVQTMLNWGVHCIAGNVEIQLREGLEDCGCDFRAGSRCDSFSKQWYPFAKAKLSESAINWMKELPDFLEFEYAGLNGLVLHGSWQETAEYIFKSTPWAIKEQSFAPLNSDLVLAGHSGLPFADQQNQKYWLNAGVIGMPANDGTPRVWYLLLDDNIKDGFSFQHHSFQYDHTEAAKLMVLHDLPKAYSLTLSTGLWDNTEILPVVEAKLSGKPIDY